MRDFRKISVWQKVIILVKKVYLITGIFPETEKFGLISQKRRAAVSIPSTISEGAAINSDSGFKRFIEIAMRSAFELEMQLEIAKELEMINEES